MIDQNIILLILILISVLVAFYSLYIGLSNSRKIKKQQQELINIINLNKESLNNINNQDSPQQPEENPEFQEFPTLEEVNAHAQEHVQENDMIPLDEDIKNLCREVNLSKL